MVDVSLWSETPNSNTTVDGINIAENCSPGNLNNAIRSVMAGVKTFNLAAATKTGTETLTNKTLTSPIINGGSLNAASTVSDTGTIATNSAGFRGIPASGNDTNTFALADNGKIVVGTSNWTIPANTSVAFPVGATLTFFNNTASTVTVAVTTDTMRQAGTANTGPRTVAPYGLVSIVKVAATTWVIAGNVT